jgi:hypothetical protein
VLCRDLLRLNVGRNHLNEFPRDAIATLKNLNQLDLSENKIGLLKPGDFQGRDKSTGANVFDFLSSFTPHPPPPPATISLLLTSIVSRVRACLSI